MSNPWTRVAWKGHSNSRQSHPLLHILAAVRTKKEKGWRSFKSRKIGRFNLLLINYFLETRRQVGRYSETKITTKKPDWPKLVDHK